MIRELPDTCYSNSKMVSHKTFCNKISRNKIICDKYKRAPKGKPIIYTFSDNTMENILIAGKAISKRVYITCNDVLTNKLDQYNNLLMYPEISDNYTDNLLSLKLLPEVYEMARKKGALIVPIVCVESNEKYYIKTQDAFDVFDIDRRDWINMLRIITKDLSKCRDLIIYNDYDERYILDLIELLMGAIDLKIKEFNRKRDTADKDEISWSYTQKLTYINELSNEVNTGMTERDFYKYSDLFMDKVSEACNYIIMKIDYIIETINNNDIESINKDIMLRVRDELDKVASCKREYVLNKLRDLIATGKYELMEQYSLSSRDSLATDYVDYEDEVSVVFKPLENISVDKNNAYVYARSINKRKNSI